MDIEIREAVCSDRIELIAMMREFYSSEAVLHPVREENFHRTFDELTSNSPYAKGYVFVSNGSICGYALIALTYSNEAGGLTVWIEELYVKERFRGRGAAARFFEYIMTEYSQAARFRLEVGDSNAAAARLYRKIGFKPLEYRQMIIDR